MNKSLYCILGFALSSVAAVAVPRVVENGTTISSGEDYVVVDDQGIETSGTVKVEQDGYAVFVTDGDSIITLAPGFSAKPTTGGKFHALATSDTDIYDDFYDLMTDSDGDGILDAIELLYGLNPLTNDANGDLDDDGVLNGDEIANGTDPMARNDWYGNAPAPAGSYSGNSIYIVEPDGTGHELNTTNMTVN